jgi:ribosomal protein S1
MKTIEKDRILLGIKKVSAIPVEGDPDFDWSVLNSDSDRIRKTSKKMRSLSVVEAFEKFYGKNLIAVETANDVPAETRIGDTLKVSVLSASKGNTVFDAGNLKDPVSSTVDLSKFPTFKRFLPKDPIEVTVVDKRKGTLYVDPIRPLYNSWERRIQDTDRQYSALRDESVEVRNLRWVPGGFIGQIDVPEISEFTGQEFLVDAFIPGSQIVLNIERDFDRWAGKTVRAFITNPPVHPSKDNRGTKSVVCSVKKYLENKGNIFKINLFKSWTEDGELWKANENVVYKGIVTGVIHSSKKCGVFVELPQVNITGLVREDPDRLSEYHPGDEVDVKITSFDEIKRYDPMVDQMKLVIPYRIENGVIRECNLKPVLEFLQEPSK